MPIGWRVKGTRKQRGCHGAATIPRAKRWGKQIPALRLPGVRRAKRHTTALLLLVLPLTLSPGALVAQSLRPGLAGPDQPRQQDQPENAAALPDAPLPEWIRLREPGSEITGTEEVILNALYRTPGSQSEFLASVEALVGQAAVTRTDTRIVSMLAGLASADPLRSAPTDRARAVSLMGRIGGPNAGTALLQTVLREPDDFVRSQAVDALIRSGLRADQRVSLTLARTLQTSAVSGLDQRTAGVALSAIEAIYTDAEEVPREVFDALIETASRGQRSDLRERAFAIARRLGGLD